MTIKIKNHLKPIGRLNHGQVFEKDCYKCKNKTETSEAELYCMTDSYDSGESVDWCKEYNLPIKDILSRDPKLKECVDFEEVSHD